MYHYYANFQRRQPIFFFSSPNDSDFIIFMTCEGQFTFSRRELQSDFTVFEVTVFGPPTRGVFLKFQRINLIIIIIIIIIPMNWSSLKTKSVQKLYTYPLCFFPHQKVFWFLSEIQICLRILLSWWKMYILYGTINGWIIACFKGVFWPSLLVLS